MTPTTPSFTIVFILTVRADSPWPRRACFRPGTSSSCAVATDFDQDGDLDVFIGRRVIPGRYPETPAADYCAMIRANGSISPKVAQVCRWVW